MAAFALSRFNQARESSRDASIAASFTVLDCLSCGPGCDITDFRYAHFSLSFAPHICEAFTSHKDPRLSYDQDIESDTARLEEEAEAAQHILMSHSVVKNSFTIVLGHFPYQSLGASFLLSTEGFNDPEERKKNFPSSFYFIFLRARRRKKGE